jgi:hypothetical protein
VPSLRRLGVEDAVAAVSQVKPGVAFEWAGMRVAFTFSRYGHRMTPYAYNAPRRIRRGDSRAPSHRARASCRAA